MRGKIPIYFLLIAIPSFAAYSDVDRILRTVLVSGGSLPSDAELFSAVGEGDQGLTSTEIRSLFPLTQKAMLDSRPTVVEIGLKILLAVSLRDQMDSAELLGPCFSDLKKIVTETGDYRKSLALKIIVLLRPSVPDSLLDFLSDNLKVNKNSDEDCRQIVAALVQSRKPAFIHQVIAFLTVSKDPLQAATAIQVFGFTHTENLEALSYIDSSLDSGDVGVKSQAVTAISRLPQTARTRFVFKLNRLATDSSESEVVRNLAIQALKN